MAEENRKETDLPLILAGPILRRAQCNRLVFWLVTSQPLQPGLILYPGDRDGGSSVPLQVEPAAAAQSLRVGENAFVHCIDAAFGEGTAYPALPENQAIGYDITLFDEQGKRVKHETMADLAYAGEQQPAFVIRRNITHLLHGSCRRPHHDSGDGLARADAWLAQRRDDPEQWPTLLVLHGDQIYADDVAGPMLRAIHALIARLGLWGETIPGADVKDDQALFTDERSYYRRDELLPHIRQNAALRDLFFGGSRKPIFTTVNARNHLITLSEVLAMYLLVWSDTCWSVIDRAAPALNADHQQLYASEERVLQAFVRDLPHTRRDRKSVV